jgi:flagellar hook-length control protein FliK
VPPGAVALERAARATEAALGVAARRGFTHARLQLHPAELGTVEVHLRHSAQGLTARVVAEAPDAVAALQQAAPELRRALEAQGVTILGLDIGARGDERRAHEGPAEPGPSRRARRGGEDADDAPEALAPVQLTPATRIALPQGALLDVIA